MTIRERIIAQFVAGVAVRLVMAKHVQRFCISPVAWAIRFVRLHHPNRDIRYIEQMCQFAEKNPLTMQRLRAPVIR